MACKMSVLKWILFVLNFMLSVLGVGLIALSVFELNTSTPGTVEHIAVVVQIFVGSFVILTSFVGCYGTCRESLGLTCSYGICLFILLSFQIYLIIAANTKDYAQAAADEFSEMWRNHTFHTLEISAIEQKYQCCGKNGTQDYMQLGMPTPEYCYEDVKHATKNRHIAGCLEPLQVHAIITGQRGLFIKWALFLIELLALAVTIQLSRSIHNQQRRAQF